MKKYILSFVSIGLAIAFAICVFVLYPKTESFGTDSIIPKIEDSEDDDPSENVDNSGNDGKTDDTENDNDTVDNNNDTVGDNDNQDHDNKNDDNPSDNNDDKTDEDKNNTNDDKNDDETDGNNIYSFVITQGTDVVYDSGYKNKFYSGKIGDNYLLYTINITSNFKFNLDHSQNISLKNASEDNFNMTLDFYILDGTEFAFQIDDDVHVFECERYLNFSHKIVVPRGQDVTIDNDTITLGDINLLKFQIIIYANDEVYPTELILDLSPSFVDTYYNFEINNSCDINVCIKDNKYNFTIKIIKNN